jgi:hypothetical protein
LQGEVAADNGKKLTAIEMRSTWHSRKASTSRGQVTKDAGAGIGAQALKEDPITGRFDRVIKKHLLLAFMDRKSYGWDHPRFDRSPVPTSAGRGSTTCSCGRKRGPDVTDEEIDDAIPTPPADTGRTSAACA